MSFDLKIDFDPGAAISGPAQVETALNKATDAAKGTGDALTQAGKAGAEMGKRVADGMATTAAASQKAAEALVGMTDQLTKTGKARDLAAGGLEGIGALFGIEFAPAAKAFQDAGGEAIEFGKKVKDGLELSVDASKMLERIEAPLRNYQSGIAGLNQLLDRGKISTDQYDAELAKLDAQLGKTRTTGLSTELQREVDTLDRLRRPMIEYEQNLAAINTLLAKGAISQSQYDAELERAQKAAGAGLGPVQGPKQQMPGEIGAGGAHAGGLGNPLADALGALSPQLGASGQLLSGLASSGVIATGAVVGLGLELVHLSDQYTTLENKVAKFTYSGDTANHILQQQLELSKELHADLATTVELYGSIREGTDELNLSRRRQLDLTREIGDAVVASGKDLSAAEGLARRLSFAFASGTIQGRELRGIFKEFPAIADGLEKSLGKSRLELLALANKGQLTASELIHAFDQMGPGVAARVAAMGETTSASWKHIMDTITLAAGQAVSTDAAKFSGWESMGALGSAPDQYQRTAKEVEAAARAHAAVMKEIDRQQQIEQERTAKTAEIVAAAAGRGISIGPFDKASADSLDKARITARLAGVELSDAFEAAKDKARLYGTEIDKLKDSDAMRKITDAAKRIYDALFGADELIYKNNKHWTDLSDQIDIARKALEKYKAAGKADSREAIETQRGLSQNEIAQNLKDYGAAVTSLAQGKDKAKGDIGDLRKAMHDGVITAEQFRVGIDHAVTTLNDGRLPYAIKTWEGIVLPLRDASEAVAGMSVSFEAGRISVTRYVEEMQKLTPALTKLQEAERLQSQMPQYLRDRALSLRSAGEQRGVIAVIDVTDQAKAAIEAQQKLLAEAERAAEDARAIAAGNGKNLPYMKSVLSFQDALGGAGANPLSPQENDAPGRALQEQLERARQLSNEFEAPAVKYEQALRDIAAAVDSWGLAEDRATVLRRRAKSTFNEEMEALSKAKGPLEQYQAAVRKLNDQYENGELSAKKLADGVNAAKVAMLEATGAAQTFQGAMQIEWIKMQQDADAFGASVAKTVVGGLDKVNEALVTMTNGGEVSFSAMANAIVGDLERILLKALEVKAIGALIGAASGGGGGGDNVALATSWLPGFATGGSWTVGGSGGADNQLQVFRATPGERVTVTPRGAGAPGAYPFAAGPGGYAMPVAAAQQAPIVNVHNHYDSSIGVASIASPAGQTQILNVLRANAPAMRSALGVK